MKLDRNSYGSIALAWSVCLAVCIPVSLFGHRIPAIIIWIILTGFCVFVTWFFRIPTRNHLGDSHNLTAVADGKICIIEKVVEEEYLHRECLQVSIYMDFFDVHANFWPIDGTVTYYCYHPGKHFLAFKPKASLENEHTCTTIVNSDGTEIFFKQLAGTFARRIVCYSKPGLQTKAGCQCGIIKFGSRIDLFLPLDAKVMVTLGQRVRACETVIAKI